MVYPLLWKRWNSEQFRLGALHAIDYLTSALSSRISHLAAPPLAPTPPCPTPPRNSINPIPCGRPELGMYVHCTYVNLAGDGFYPPPPPIFRQLLGRFALNKHNKKLYMGRKLFNLGRRKRTFPASKLELQLVLKIHYWHRNAPTQPT